MGLQQCGECRYWRELPAEKQTEAEPGVLVGECLRYPPMPHPQYREATGHPAGGNADYYSGPITRQIDWCGEFKQR